jgi:uncharacterized protein YuzE
MDTILSASEVTVTKEISENVYVDLDANGNLVSMTIEHPPGERESTGSSLRSHGADRMTSFAPDALRSRLNTTVGQ